MSTPTKTDASFTPDDDDEPDEREDCMTCDGAGWVDDPSDGGTMDCPDCEGSGKQD